MIRHLLSLFAASAIARADFDPARWQFRRSIKIEKPVPVASFIVDRSLYRGSRAHLADLRIARDQKETPYMIRELEVLDEIPLEPAISQETNTHTTLVTVDTGLEGLPHDRVQLVIEPGQFYRSVKAESSRDSRKWRQIGEGFIFRTEDMGAFTVSFAEQWDRYLRIRISNGDNPPLVVRQVILSADRRVVEFPGEATGRYWLYYGSPGARQPSYDFAQTRPAHFQPVIVILGAEQNNPAYRENQKPWTDQRPEVLYAVLAAAIVGMGSSPCGSCLRFGPNSATLAPGVFSSEMLIAEPPPFLAGVRTSLNLQIPLVGVLIGDLPQQIPKASKQRSHNSSVCNWDKTKGASSTLDVLEPLRIPYQTRMESTKMIATRIMKTPHTKASSRSLKI